MTENNPTASVIKTFGYIEIVLGIILGFVMFTDFEAIFAIIVIISSFISGVLLIGFGEIIELLHQINKRQKQTRDKLQRQEKVGSNKAVATQDKLQRQEKIGNNKAVAVEKTQQSNIINDNDLMWQEVYIKQVKGKYSGELKDGLPHGNGIFIKDDGEKYVGEFEDGKYHGKGTITFTDGHSETGRWKGNRQMERW